MHELTFSDHVSDNKSPGQRPLPTPPHQRQVLQDEDRRGRQVAAETTRHPMQQEDMQETSSDDELTPDK